MRHWLVLPCAALVAAGCSTSPAPQAEVADTAPPLAGDGGDARAPDEAASGPETAAGEGASDSAAVCNTLANAAPVITTQQVATAPPTPKGGVVADGTYLLTDVTIYTGPGGPVGPGGTARTTVQITGATVQVANAGEPATRTVLLQTSGATFTSTDTCPDMTILRGGYTATTTTFAIQIDGGTDDAGARTVVETFTLQ